MIRADSFQTRRMLDVGGRRYAYYSLPSLSERLGGGSLARMPFSLKVLLENLLRNEDGTTITAQDVESLARWPDVAPENDEVAFYPARVLMPDSSGIPLMIDLAAMRDAVQARGLDPRLVNPLIPTDLVLDHSVVVDFAGSADAFDKNLALELVRNRERYGVVRWAKEQYANLRVIPPGNGILHQINIEYLASVVATAEDNGETLAFPDSLVGMDSHTPMINGLGIFGWGVGGIEAATAMLGEPVSLTVPRVVGCRVVGRPPAGVMCTDIVLTLTRLLRKAGVLGAVVEFTGPGLEHLSVADRGTLANMAPEYGATMGFFPLDARSIEYLRDTSRPPERIALVEAYAKAQGLWRDPDAQAPAFERLIELDLATIEAVVAGPIRPEERVPIGQLPVNFRSAFAEKAGTAVAAPVQETRRPLRHGDIAIASITSCTNTSNPFQMVAAGLLARNAVARGLAAKPWVKTSLSPGSRVVSSMLRRAGLLEPLAQLGFHVVGYGCMSCGGGAGPICEKIAQEITDNGLVALGVLSSNRNFEGRLHAAVRGTYLASPPLVIAYAIVGSVLVDLSRDAIGQDASGGRVHLADLWPSDQEIRAVMEKALNADLFASDYGTLAEPGPEWDSIPYGREATFAWDRDSTYLKPPPYFDDLTPEPFAPADISGARALLVLGDDVTTDHISPGGPIPVTTPSGAYLRSLGVRPVDFDRYVGRRANHDVMIRGTFANVRIKNEMVAGREGGFTRLMPSGDLATVFDAAVHYRGEGVPLIVVAGRNYGCGSSRDWAAKGTRLLGIGVVVAESFERIHRSNLLGMGVLPLEFVDGTTRRTLGLDGSETYDISGLQNGFKPRARLRCRITRKDGSATETHVVARIDTAREMDWYRNGGILPYALRRLVAREQPSSAMH